MEFQRFGPRLVCAALTMLAAAACAPRDRSDASGRPPAKPVVSSARIWFHPMPSASQWPNGPPGNLGSTDFLDLFGPKGAWMNGAAHTAVFGLYAGWVAAAREADLRTTISFLNGHHMDVELEAPALAAQPNCGTGVEGYVPWGPPFDVVTRNYLLRLRSFGAHVAFVKVDEPFYFGSVVSDARACHLEVSQVASQVVRFAQLVNSVYPHAQVGDVEPIISSAYNPDAVTAISAWHDVYRSIARSPFPFFFADPDFNDPRWPPTVLALEKSSHRRGIRFGILYTGDQQDDSDAMWSGKAISRFQIYQSEHGGRPDFVLFQSWEPHPTRLLPETDPTTLTGVLNAYVKSTNLAKRRNKHS